MLVCICNSGTKLNHRTIIVTYVTLTTLAIVLSVISSLVPTQHAFADEDKSSTETETEDEIDCTASGWDYTLDCNGDAAVDEENEETIDLTQETPFILPLAF
jgi:hypothetical protein